jgi:hypothetical protein
MPCPSKKPRSSLRLLSWMVNSPIASARTPRDHRRHFGIEADAQRVLADHVDVALVELAEAAALGALAAVHALHLVAAEREGQLVLVLGHVAGQRHGQVEAQGQLGQAVAFLLQRAGGLHEIHLALGLAAGLGQQHLGQLEHRRFHRQEAEALVVAADRVQHALEGDLVAGSSSMTPGGVRGLIKRKTPGAHAAANAAMPASLAAVPARPAAQDGRALLARDRGRLNTMRGGSMSGCSSVW